MNSLSQPLIVNNTVIEDNREKANLLNNYFAEQSTIDEGNSELPYVDPLPRDNIMKIHITKTGGIHTHLTQNLQGKWP